MSATMASPPVFEPSGACFMPTSSATGPWSHDHLHGGPVIGLLARAVERTAADPALVCARLSVDLFRPAPHAPLHVETRCIKKGSRLTLIDAQLFAHTTEIARASALMLREGTQSASEHVAAAVGPEGLPTETLWRGANDPSIPEGFHTRVETRWVPSSGGEPLAIWFRLPMPLVAGEEPSDFQKAAALCDFANAVVSLAAARRRAELAAYINADCTLYLSRRPQGEWFCLQGLAGDWDHGVSVATVSIADVQGVLGSVSQARLAAARS